MDAIEKLDDLRELIGEYWCLAFAEGQEGRNTDTEDGAAQKCISAIEAIIREMRTALTPPEGYVLVPVEPTEAMLDAGLKFWTPMMTKDDIRLIYEDALSARPEVKP